MDEDVDLRSAAPGGLAERARTFGQLLRCSRAEALALGVLGSGALVALGLLWVLANGGGDPGTAVVMATPGPASSGPSPSPVPSEVVVHVAGHVAAPGVHQLPGGSRVGDAVASAGGPLPGAVLEALNLARPLADGEQIVVPPPGAAPMASAPPETATAQRADGLLDLNRATAEDLEELPGVGPVLAERIIAHRQSIGSFRSVDELRDVRGVGDATFDELAPLVAV